MPPRRNAPPSAESPAASVPTPTLWPAWSTRTNCVLLFLAALVAYWPALGGGTIWDDAGHITRPDLQSLDGLWRIWFVPGETQQYYPLLHSAFWLEHHLWGDAALGYHLINVLLHATAACLFATFLRKLSVPGAWLAAAGFTLHPVCVESVAWVSEQKNTLSTVLYLCSLLAGRVVWFYLGKLIWPGDLIFIYPRWTIDSGVAWQWLFPIATLTLLGVAAWWARRSRAPLAALLIFGGLLFPALGFVNVYPFIFSFVADHFQYLACLGAITLVPAAVQLGLARLPHQSCLSRFSAR